MKKIKPTKIEKKVDPNTNFVIVAIIFLKFNN